MTPPGYREGPAYYNDTERRKRFTELHDPLGKIDSALKEAD